MISTKKLITLARKWKKLAAASRRRISSFASTSVTDGHFVIYTIDGRRFVISLEHLKSELLRELLRMAEEEFGVSEGHITLPCDSNFMEYAISILQRHANEDLEKVVMMSMDSCRSSLSSSILQQEHNNQHVLISIL